MCKVLGVNIVALTFEYDLIVLGFFWYISLLISLRLSLLSFKYVYVLNVVSLKKKKKSNNVLELNSINYHYR